MHQRVKPHKFNGIYGVMLKNGTKRLATKNLTPGRNIYGERLVKHNGIEYRIWDPYRSKLAAAILKKIKKVPLNHGQKILYLGAASGTTASHISDIVGEKGHIYCVEFAPRTIRELVNNVCTARTNISPILEDARFPDRYKMFIDGKVDLIYCDIAQPEQAKILVYNSNKFLSRSGWIMLAVKAQSIDVTRKPSEIYKQEIAILEKHSFNVKDTVYLEPYDKAHAMIVARHVQ